MNLNCPLCNGISSVFCEKPKHLFYKCTNCDGIFRPKHTFLTAEEEKAHYKKHNNDIYDERYQNFVSSIVNAVSKDFSPETKGLDFGSGTGLLLSKIAPFVGKITAVDISKSMNEVLRIKEMDCEIKKA